MHHIGRLYIVFLFFTNVLFAQDIHFLNYRDLSAVFNPALTASDASFKASVIHKEQWKSVTNSFKTYGANIELRLMGKTNNKKSSLNSNSKSGGLNAGLLFLSDKAGGGILNRNRAALSLSSGIKIKEHQRLSAGLTGSYMLCRLDYSGLLFPNQYNGYNYNAAMASGETFVLQQYALVDVASGLLWTFDRNLKGFDMNKLFNARLGFSVHHLVRARSEFLHVNSREQLRMVMHGDFTKSVGIKNMSVSPEFLVQLKGPASEFLLGNMFRHYFSYSTRYTGYNKQSSFAYGVYYRFRDAIVFAVNLGLREQYSFFASYDLNVSQLRVASNYRGGFELGIRYTAPQTYLYKDKQR
jgi:type IX secretion system PorP/SprF family membrane protein